MLYAHDLRNPALAGNGHVQRGNTLRSTLAHVLIRVRRCPPCWRAEASGGRRRSGLASGPDHESVGHGHAAVTGPEAPSVRSRALGNVGFENARAAFVRGGRGQGDAAPAFLEGRGPVDLRSGYPVLQPYVPMPSNVPVGNTQPVRFNEVPGPAAQAFWRRGGSGTRTPALMPGSCRRRGGAQPRRSPVRGP